MNANLIFKWLRDELYAPAVDVVQETGSPGFLPVAIEASTSLYRTVATAPIGRIEIELSSGRRITAEGAFDADVLAQLLRGLSS